MLLRTLATLISGSAFVACGLILGCNPQVDYKPKISSPPRKTESSGTKAATKTDGTKSNGAVAQADGKNQIEAGPSTPASDLIAYDEFDGVHRAGWKEPGLGEWKSVGEERDGALVVAGDVDIYRALAQPVDDIVWFAVTMRMDSPITGIASVDGSPGPPKRFFKMGFSAVDQPYTSRGFWMDTDKDTRIENTELQTFLTRYSFGSHIAEGFYNRGFGLALIDNDGMVFQRPRMKMDGTFSADRFSHVSLKKGGPEKLIIERIAIARTPEGALTQQLPAIARRPDYQPPETAQPKPAAAETKTDAAAVPTKTDGAKPAEPPANVPATDKPAEPKTETKSETKKTE